MRPVAFTDKSGPHAVECGGYPFCDGCGYIAEDGLWYALDDEPCS